MKVSKNFTLAEFTHSATAVKQGIDNAIPDLYIPNVISLCYNVLQPLRDYLGKPITITSGYRSYELNVVVGGVPTSDHRTAHAGDFTTEDLEKAFNYIKNNLQFTQLIWYRTRGFLHVSYHANNLKKQVLYK